MSTVYIISTPSLLQLLLCPIPSQTRDLFFYYCYTHMCIYTTYEFHCILLLSLYCLSFLPVRTWMRACVPVYVSMSQHWDWITYRSFSLKKNKLFSHQPCVVGNSSFMGGACIVSPISVYVKDSEHSSLETSSHRKWEGAMRTAQRGN